MQQGFAVSAKQFNAVHAGLQAATLADHQSAFLSAGQLLSRIQDASKGLKENVLGTALRIVAGQRCGDALAAMMALDKAMRDAKAAGSSSVRTIASALQALAAHHTGDFIVPTWSTAAEARAAGAAAKAALVNAAGKGAAPADGTDNGAGAGDAPAGGGAADDDAAAALARMQAECEELRAVAAALREKFSMPDASYADLLATVQALAVNITEG